MTIRCNGEQVSVDIGTTLFGAVRQLSPFGDDPIIVLLNGARVAMEAETVLQPNDDIMIYPLLIGG